MCDHNISCGIHGLCSINNTCVCTDMWATVYTDTPCMYKRHDRVFLIVLHVLFGYTGVSAFILDWTLYGLLLLTSFSLTCVSAIQSSWYDQANTIHVPECWSVLYILFIMVNIISYAIVLVLLIYECVDGMGVKCLP